MGWKNVKQHYRIGHHVHVNSEGICIGSPYIPDIMVISIEGELVKCYRDRSNPDLMRYQAEMDADPAKLAELVKAPDVFDNALVVYTYDDGDILERRCEEYGWPNVTHDGQMMYDNQFSADRAQVVKWAKSNAAAGVRMYDDMRERKRQELAELDVRAQKMRDAVAKLERDFPTALDT